MLLYLFMTEFREKQSRFEPSYKDDKVEEHYPAPRLAPETYPGNFSRYPCTLLNGSELSIIRWSPESKLTQNRGHFDPVIDTLNSGPISLDTYLSSQDVPNLAERYALTAFGSNRNPGQLLDKFRKADVDEDTHKKLEIVPMFTGTMKGYDAVYNSKPGNLGYFFADLYQGPETVDTEIEVAVLFLTKEQLAVLHESEKAYDFKLLSQVELGKKQRDNLADATTNIPAFAHVGKATAYADRTSGRPRPIALSEVRAINRNLRELTQTGFQDHFFSYDPDGGKRNALVAVSGMSGIEPNGENYRAHMKMESAGGLHKLAPRKLFQAELLAAMGEEERMLIDPDQFRALGVDFDKHTLPRLGDIAVINFIEAMSR